MKLQRFMRGRSAKPTRGFTLLELIIATSIVVILSTMAVPLARLTIQRERERLLRADLWQMRDAIDRYKDALRRRGENISSYEVEQVILSHPSVIECTVLGVPAEVEAGEDEVLAVIVSDDLDPAKLWAWCDGRLPAFAMPRFVRFVDAIPRTPSEKVRKSVLREQGITPDTHDRTSRSAS